MANLCDTQYKITGEKKAVADLWNTLQEMNVNEKNIWLGDLANHYGIDYKAKGFSVRGEIECGWGIFCVHDEGEHFPEECCVSAYGEPFEAMNEEPFDTVADAIEVWCEKTGIKRGERSDEEMLDYIAQYEYEDDETFFFINKFEFE